MIEYVNDLLDVLMFLRSWSSDVVDKLLKDGTIAALEQRLKRLEGGAAPCPRKSEQSREANQPVWFDGKSINEALFCDDF